MDAGSAARRAVRSRTAKSCGSGAPTLTPSWRRCLSIAPMTGARKPGPREEHEGNRKTIARGMPGETGVTVVTTLVCLLHLHARLRAHQTPGIPCALCRAEGAIELKIRARFALRKRGVMLINADRSAIFGARIPRLSKRFYRVGKDEKWPSLIPARRCRWC
jgi:hypothetical protein